VERWFPLRRTPSDLETTTDAPADRDPRHRAVIIGYGPVGRTVARLLRENGITPTIIDLNIDTVRELRDQGQPAIYGDATLRETLISAGVPGSGSIVLSIAGLPGANEVIRASRELNPAILILARTAYIRELVALKQAGATQVYAGESEVALAFSEAILHRLGATPEQIDRERARVHSEILA
jgi:CPA2 family monovalent cation:H+ antiporter-2